MISSDNLLLEPHNYFEPSCFGSRGVIFLIFRNSNYFNHYFAWFFPTVFFLRKGVGGKGNNLIGRLYFHRSN